MTLYKNRYRIDSTRLPHWDYSKDGWYFVTICARDMALFFGKIVDHDVRDAPARRPSGSSLRVVTVVGLMRWPSKAMDTFYIRPVGRPAKRS